MLLAVDDVQWLDSSSARVLQMALRRLGEERVGLLATVREEPQGRMLDFDQVFAAGRLGAHRLRP